MTWYSFVGFLGQSPIESGGGSILHLLLILILDQRELFDFLCRRKVAYDGYGWRRGNTGSDLYCQHESTAWPRQTLSGDGRICSGLYFKWQIFAPVLCLFSWETSGAVTLQLRSSLRCISQNCF